MDITGSNVSAYWITIMENFSEFYAIYNVIEDIKIVSSEIAINVSLDLAS